MPYGFSVDNRAFLLLFSEMGHFPPLLKKTATKLFFKKCPIFGVQEISRCPYAVKFRIFSHTMIRFFLFRGVGNPACPSLYLNV